MYLRNRRVGETWPNSHVHTHVIYVNVYQMFGSCFKHLFIYICKYILFFDTHLYIDIYIYLFVCVFVSSVPRRSKIYTYTCGYMYIYFYICMYLHTLIHYSRYFHYSPDVWWPFNSTSSKLTKQWPEVELCCAPPISAAEKGFPW